MKVLHISTTIEWRGGDKQLLTTYEVLKNFKDIQHSVLCPEGSILSEKCKAIGLPHFTASRKSKFSLPFLKKIIKITRQEGFDTIHVHDSIALSLTSIAIKFLPGISLIYSRKRNNRIKNNYFKRVKYNNPRISKIICVSQAVKDVLVPVLNNPEKAKVIYDGIDVDNLAQNKPQNILRNEYHLDPDTIIIGNVAGLTKQKDFFTFLDTARIILNKSDKKIKFLVIGEGPLENEIKDYCKTLGLTHDVIFTGFRNDVHKVLPEFDIFLISSDTEGLPLSVLEAFSCQVPVVATAAGGTGEAVKNRETGMLSPVKDASKLAENTLEVINDLSLRALLKENAFHLVSRKFTLDVMQQEYYSFYKNLQKMREQKL